TWNNTAKWRAAQIEVLTQVSKDMKAKFGTHEWEFHGQDFLSWIWIDVKDARVADVLVEAARVAGTPVRAGKYGYERPTYVRIKVGLPDKFEVLAQAWKSIEQLD
ncbi:hypothetical protein BCR44DRAFT_1500399, partial [Catenaria anguillulae PL171]